ncbi:unnamed protein product [Durusdinium trenchii]|uniref:SEP domain-containing protein n=1 Tax=Durusdinium trenchii TaxID=1381693 RepID=A0ABP0NB58_9DINO
MVAQPLRRPIRLGEDDLDNVTPDIQSSILSALLQDRPSLEKESPPRRREATGVPGMSRPPLPQAGAAVLNRETREVRRPRSGDNSLVSSMASRLAQVEQTNKQLTAKLQKQNLEMEELREQLARARQHTSPGCDSESLLQAECDRLSRQVEEMKQFMADYGLPWRPRSGSGVAVDIQVIQTRIEALNSALEQETKVVQEKAGGGVCARLSTMETLPLTFFRDGLKLADHGFMLFQSSSAQDAIRDLLEGFLPRQLREEHPKGVALKVLDRTKMSFRQWLKEAMEDPELVDGGSRLRVSVGQALHDPQDTRSASERFVAQLPERVLRKGQVCQVRSAIAQRLGVDAGPRSASAPPPSGHQEVALLAIGRPADAPAARLQVKLESGQKVLLKMEFDATIGDLWEALADWRSKQKVGRTRPGAVLRTAFPPKSYTDRKQMGPQPVRSFWCVAMVFTSECKQSRHQGLCRMLA